MSSLTIPNLTLRESKGSSLTNAEIDANWKTLRNFCNSLAALFGVSLNTDGSLKDGTVGEDAILNRAITSSKLALDSLPFFNDTGTTNNFVVTPDPAITEYASGLLLFVRAANSNTGPAVLKVNALESIAIKKRGTYELESGDIAAGQVFAVCYYSGAFQLVSGVGAASSSVNSGGQAVDETGNLQGVIFSAAAALTGSGTTLEFTHALNGLPDTQEILLECVTPDSDFISGDTIPIEELTSDDATLTPAFKVYTNASKVYVTQLSDTVYRELGGDALTLTKWQVRVKATRNVSPSVGLPAPLPITVQRPDGGISYGQYIYVLSRGYSSSDNNRLLRIDTQTGAISLVGSVDTNYTKANWSMYRNDDDEDILCFTCKKGIHITTLQKPAGAWVISDLVASTDYEYYRLLAIDEAGGPDLYIAPQQMDSGTNSNKVSAFVMKKVVVGGATTTFTAVNFTSAQNVTDFAALVDGNAKVLGIIYNPIKKRIYLWDNSSGFLHMFRLGTTVTAMDVDLEDWLTTGAVDYTKLHFEKSIVMGFGGVWTDRSEGFSESIAIEFDLGTGEERAIVVTQSGRGSSSDGYNQGEMPGVVTRVSWRE